MILVKGSRIRQILTAENRSQNAVTKHWDFSYCSWPKCTCHRLHLKFYTFSKCIKKKKILKANKTSTEIKNQRFYANKLKFFNPVFCWCQFLFTLTQFKDSLKTK